MEGASRQRHGEGRAGQGKGRARLKIEKAQTSPKQQANSQDKEGGVGEDGNDVHATRLVEDGKTWLCSLASSHLPRSLLSPGLGSSRDARVSSQCFVLRGGSLVVWGKGTEGLESMENVGCM